MKKQVNFNKLYTNRNFMRELIDTQTTNEIKIDYSHRPLQNLRKVVNYLIKNISTDNITDIGAALEKSWSTTNFIDTDWVLYTLEEAKAKVKKEDLPHNLERMGHYVKGDARYVLGYEERNGKKTPYIFGISLNNTLDRKQAGNAYYTSPTIEHPKTVLFTLNNVRELAIQLIIQKWVEENITPEDIDKIAFRENYKGERVPTGDYEKAIKYFPTVMVTKTPAEAGRYLGAHVLSEVAMRGFKKDYYSVIHEIRQNKYEVDSKTDYARAFQTKKNIPDATLAVMKNTSILQSPIIKYVEIDQSFKLEEFHQIENTFHEIAKILPTVPKPHDLRFRRLGNLKAIGVYYNAFDCISLDIRNTSAFIHEYGHAIDYKFANLDDDKTNLSLGTKFRDILDGYITAFEEMTKDEEISFTNKWYNYYTTPTEVFARAYEVFIEHNYLNGVQTSLNKGANELQFTDVYAPLYKMYDLVNAYFTELYTQLPFSN